MIDNSLIRLYLQKTLEVAEETAKLGNYPIGVVIVNDKGECETVVGNQCASASDVTAHAEILAFRKLGKKIDKDSSGDYYLFSSLEPCFGCSFFLARTNIHYIYSALKDPHKGGISDLAKQKVFHHFFDTIDVVNEPFEDLKNRSKKLMQQYFIAQGKKDTVEFYL